MGRRELLRKELEDQGQAVCSPADRTFMEPEPQDEDEEPRAKLSDELEELFAGEEQEDGGSAAAAAAEAYLNQQLRLSQQRAQAPLLTEP